MQLSAGRVAECFFTDTEMKQGHVVEPSSRTQVNQVLIHLQVKSKRKPTSRPLPLEPLLLFNYFAGVLHVVSDFF